VVITEIRCFRLIRNDLCLDAWNRFVWSLTPYASFGRDPLGMQLKLGSGRWATAKMQA